MINSSFNQLAMLSLTLQNVFYPLIEPVMSTSRSLSAEVLSKYFFFFFASLYFCLALLFPGCRTQHFLLNIKLLAIAQCSSSSRSFTKPPISSQSQQHLPDECHQQTKDTFHSRSLINMLNRTGPIIISLNIDIDTF